MAGPVCVGAGGGSVVTLVGEAVTVSLSLNRPRTHTVASRGGRTLQVHGKSSGFAWSLVLLLFLNLNGFYDVTLTIGALADVLYQTQPETNNLVF